MITPRRAFWDDFLVDNMYLGAVIATTYLIYKRVWQPSTNEKLMTEIK